MGTTVKNEFIPKLLFVEDDYLTIDVVKKLLKNKYEIDNTNNGTDALRMANETDYQAFLIDIGLPGSIDGMEITKKLKEIKNNKDKPYIAVTAYAMSGDREFFLSEGLTHYISKPFDRQTLIDVIGAALKK